MKFRAMWVAVVAAWCATAQAAPLNLKQVAADAKWLVHLDVDAMRESSLVERAYLAGSQQWSQVELWLSIASYEVGVDPRVDLHGVTLFGTRLGKLEGIALLHAEMQPSVMISRAKAENGYQAGDYGKHQIHSWSDGTRTVAGAFFQPTLLVVARSEKEVQEALDVLDGKAPSLAAEKPPVVEAGPRGSMLAAWAQGLDAASLKLRSPAIKKSKAVGLFVGENGGRVFASAKLVMESGDTADKVLAVLQGIRAAAELQYEGDASVTNLVKHVKLAVGDRTVSVQLQAPAGDVWKQLNRLLARLAPTH